MSDDVIEALHNRCNELSHGSDVQQQINEQILLALKEHIGIMCQLTDHVEVLKKRISRLEGVQ